MANLITKEFLDMTFPDKYYKDVIEPAKMGKGPVPSKVQMLGRAQPFKALSLPVQNFFSPGKYDAFRAAPTGAVRTAVGSNVAYGLPFAYAGMANLLQDKLEEEGLTGEGGIYDISGGWGAMGAGADIPIIQKMLVDRRATQQGIAQIAMQKQIQQAQDAGGTGGAQPTLQAQITAQANREARERVGRGEARDYGHTQTRSSSGWRSDPMWKGGIVDLYRYGGFI
jgi:hypothetical protein